MFSARLAGTPAEDPGTRRFRRGAAGSPLPGLSKSGGVQSGGKSWGGCCEHFRVVQKDGGSAEKHAVVMGSYPSERRSGFPASMAR